MHRSRNLILTVVCAVCALAPARSRAEGTSASVQTAITASGGNDNGKELNDMNRGDNPYNPVRALILARGDVSENTSLFLEVPIDLGSSGSTWLSYMRPFIRVEEIAGGAWVNLQAGKLPTVFGTYGERSNSTGRALIGVPLLYYYRTAVRPELIVEGPDYFFEPGVRGGGKERVSAGGTTSFHGAPIIYDSCWDIGTEVYGGHGGVEYTGAVTLGTISQPANSENPNDGYGLVGRVGYRVQSEGALFGLRVGVSGAAGPYLDSAVADDPQFPPGADVEDFLNTGIGVDAAYARGPWEFIAEAGRVGYEVPNVEPTLHATSWYLEVVRDFGPAWSVGLRGEQALFDDITASDGSAGPWDYDVNRMEAAVNWRFRMNARLRVSYQASRFPDAEDLDGDVVGVQLQVWTR